MRIAAFAVALAFSGGAASQVPPLSFKGIELGKATKDDVIAKFPGARGYGSVIHADANKYADEKCGTIAMAVRNSTVSNCRLETASAQLFRIGQTSSGDFHFTEHEGKIEELRATFSTGSYPAVVAAFREKYGMPTATEKEGELYT